MEVHQWARRDFWQNPLALSSEVGDTSTGKHLQPKGIGMAKAVQDEEAVPEPGCLQGKGPWSQSGLEWQHTPQPRPQRDLPLGLWGVSAVLWAAGVGRGLLCSRNQWSVTGKVCPGWFCMGLIFGSVLGKVCVLLVLTAGLLGGVQQLCSDLCKVACAPNLGPRF